MAIKRSTTHVLTAARGQITVEEARKFFDDLMPDATLTIKTYSPDRPGETGTDTIEVTEEL